jgi:hypothetical protein
MRNRAIFFFAILAVLFCPAASLAQQVHFSARDEMMLMAVEQLSERQQLPAGEISFSSREEVISASINQLEDGKQALDKPIEEPQASIPQTSKKNTPGIGLVSSYLKKTISRIHPYLSAQATLNDNAGLSRKKRSSLQYITSAGVRTSYLTKARNSFNLDVFMNNAYYERHAEQNSQGLTVNSQYNFGVRRNTFSIGNSYFTNYIADDSFGIKTDLQRSYWADTLSLSWGKHFNRIGFDIGGARSESSYEDEYKTMDAATNSLGIGQYLFIGKKSRLSLGYYYRSTKHERVPTSDSRFDSFSLELAGVVSPKITGAFSINYDTSDLKEGIDSRTRDFGLGFAYRISNRSSLSLDLVHTVFDDTSGAMHYSTEDSFNLSVKHRLAFNPRLSLGFSSAVLFKDYPKWEGPHNDYSIYGLGLGLGYAFRQWLDLSLSWGHSRKYSNIDTNYNQNTVVFMSSARF